MIGYSSGQDGAKLPSRAGPQDNGVLHTIMNPFMSKFVRSRWLDITLKLNNNSKEIMTVTVFGYHIFKIGIDFYNVISLFSP